LAVKPIIHITATSLKEELHTTGNSPIKVIGSDYNMYVAKNSKNKNPATDIINEVLAHYFLTLWEVPTPNIALITIDPAHLLPEYSDNHRPHYYNNAIFASQWINNSVDSSILFEINKKKDYEKFNNPEILFKIGLFDIWVENDDRKPTNHNLLFQTINGKQNIIPIDHSFIFSTMNYSDLDPTMFSPIENENIFVSNLGASLKRYKKKNKKWQPINRDYFYLCVQNCKQEYANIVANIPISWGFTAEHQTKLYDFLFDDERNKLVYDEFEYKLR
jgi:hypothetical protein